MFKTNSKLIFSIVLISITPFILNLLGVKFDNNLTLLSNNELISLKENSVSDYFFYIYRGAFTHSLLEWTAVCFAFIASALAFVQYRMKKDLVTPIIGMALLCSGVMDAYHTLAATRLIEAVADNTNFIPFTWALSRIFNAIIMLVGISLIIISKNRIFQNKSSVKNSFLIITNFVFLLSAIIIMYISSNSTQLPQTMYPNAFFTRPFDVLPLVIYLITLAFVLPKFYKTEKSVFAISLIIVIIPEIITEAHMAFGSTKLFDNHFNIAHFLKTITYGIPLIGIIYEYIATYNHESELVELRDLNLLKMQDKEAELEYTLQALEGYKVSLNETALVAITDLRGTIKYANKKFTKLSEYTREELIGKNHRILKPDLNQDALYTNLWKTISSGNIWRGEICNKAKSGKIYWVDATIVPILGIDSKPYEYFAMRIDITSKKEQEKLLGKNIKLEREKDVAIKTGKLKEEFLANMSHEIRTPMNAIMGLSSLLTKNNDSLTDKQIEYINSINLNSKNLLGVISDILDFSKIEANRITLAEYPFNLNDSLSNLIYTLQSSANEKGIYLKLVTSDNFDYFIDGDWIRLNQILTNLIANAIKFTNEGGVKLSIKKINENDKTITLSFNVIDTGIGIPLDKQEVIFEPFTQANSTTTRDFGGTGLGLSIVQKFINLFNSSINVVSEEGKGTKMFFNIAFNKSKTEVIIDDSNSKSDTTKLNNTSILIIENEEFTYTIIKETINEINSSINIFNAKNKNEVFEMLTIQSFDVILLNVDSIDMKESHLTSIKNECLKLHTPIIFITDEDNKAQIEKFNSMVVNSYITSPITEEEITKALLNNI